MSRNRFVSLFVGLALLAALPACQTGVGRAAVSLRLNRAKATPKDAGVWIDEEYLGPLTYVVIHGVRLPVGKHRITVQKAGYFPWDREVVADREAITLDIVLDPVPD
ncbi:MAG TPA: PEGA domain-containing protein [Polyangiaceae bacterium]|nr:PEGA domain-containing protein [Polyangiaceae bacterium]